MSVAVMLRLAMASLMVLVSLGGAAHPAQTNAHAKDAAVVSEMDTQELREIVSLLEDPQKREVFLRNLKAIIRLREAGFGEQPMEPPPETPAKRTLVPIEGLFSRFESFTQRLGEASADLLSMTKKAPEALHNTRVFFSSPANRTMAGRLVIVALVAILCAFLVRFLLRRPLGLLSAPEGLFLLRCLKEAGVVLLSLAPYGASLVALFFLMPILPSFDAAQGGLLLFFWILFFYRLALSTFRGLLHPEDASRRLIPISDESAAYLWVWVGRFANYSFFYFLVTGLVQIAGMDRPEYLFLRGILMLGFPIMITVLILQVTRDLRTKLSGEDASNPDGKTWGRTLRFAALRYGPLVVVLYCWAVFAFLIASYERGFSYLLKATLSSAVIIAVFIWVRTIIHKAFERFFAISDQVRSRFPGLEQRANRYILLFRKGMVLIVGIITGAMVAQVWGIPISAFISSQAGSMLMFRSVAVAITVVIVMMAWEGTQVIRKVIMDPEQWERKGREPSQKTKTLVPLVCTAVKIGAAFVGGIVILDQIGVNVNPILAGAGIVGLAVGFGSQTLVKDLINGLFFLFEESIRVGDIVVIGDKGGMVENVGLRTVKIRDLAGNVHIIPNSSIDRVMNMTKDFSRYVFDVGVAYKEDVDEVMDILREIGEDMQNDPKFGPDILKPLEIMGVDRFEDSAVIIRARITTKPLRQWDVGREFNRRLKKVFDERGIEIPFPHRTIYMGEPKMGEAPALPVKMLNVQGDGGGSGGKRKRVQRGKQSP